MTGSSTATCPSCGSPSIQAVPIQRQKVSEPGLVEVLLQTEEEEDRPAETETVIQAVCLKCGAKWFPGTKEEEEMRAMSGQLGEQAKTEMRQVVATRQR
jgi:predicted  nucleic acid-binding Zn-ribbon protein